MPINSLYSRLKEKWGRRGELKLIDLEADSYLAKFSNREDKHHVLVEGPWIIAGHYLSIQKWKPDFDATSERIKKTAAWIRIPELSIEYFEKDVLERVGNSLGKTLRVDHHTASQQRGQFARISVEEKPLVPLRGVKIGNRWHKVEILFVLNAADMAIVEICVQR